MAFYSLKNISNPRVQNLCVSSVFDHRPLKIFMSQQNQRPNHWQSIRADIEAHLKQVMPLKTPLSVHKPMNHFTFSVPPGSAPELCLAACELVGGRQSHAMAAAAALHLVQAAASVHENLPLMGRPEPRLSLAHQGFAPNIELLIPDAMVPFGFELLARSGDLSQSSSDRILRVIVELTRVGGSDGVVGGIYQEMLFERLNDVSRDIKWVDDMCRKKEGALHACAAACGAILGGANEEETENLRKYGLYVGMIRGYANRIDESKGRELERVVELRNLAIKELQHFQGRNVEPISSFVIGL